MSKRGTREEIPYTDEREREIKRLERLYDCVLSGGGDEVLKDDVGGLRCVDVGGTPGNWCYKRRPTLRRMVRSSSVVGCRPVLGRRRRRADRGCSKLEAKTGCEGRCRRWRRSVKEPSMTRATAVEVNQRRVLDLTGDEGDDGSTVVAAAVFLTG